MGYRAWACAGTALLVAITPQFSAFAQSAAPSNPLPANASPANASIVPVLNPAAQSALQNAIAGSQRIEPARDRWRNPAATLQFFGVRPTDTVIEIWPGQGWYTSILGPYLKQGSGSLIVGHFDAASTSSSVVRQIVDAYRARFASNQAAYGSVSVVPFGPRSGPLGMPGTVDSVLTFRNIHNWMAQGWAEKAFGDFFLVLKPGGILGIEEHRGRTDEPQDPLARDGYVREDFVIQLAREAGFEFIGRSEINANPADTKDHPFGVWTLPPVSRSSPLGQRDDPGFDRTRYDAIGESDRMTLRFRKPLNATGAPPSPGTRWTPVIVAPALPPPPKPPPPAARPPLPRPAVVAAPAVTQPAVTPAIAAPTRPIVVRAPQVTPSSSPPAPMVAVQATPSRPVGAPAVAPSPSSSRPENSEAAAPRIIEPAPRLSPPPTPVVVSSPAPTTPATTLPTAPATTIEAKPLGPIETNSSLPVSPPVSPAVVQPTTLPPQMPASPLPAPAIAVPNPIAKPPINNLGANQPGPAEPVTTPQIATAIPPVTPTPAVAQPAVPSPATVRPATVRPAILKPAATASTPTRPPAVRPPAARPPASRAVVAPPTGTLASTGTKPATARSGTLGSARPIVRPTPKGAQATPATGPILSRPTVVPKAKAKAPSPSRPPARPSPPAPKAKSVSPPAPANPNKPDWVVPRRRS